MIIVPVRALFYARDLPDHGLIDDFSIFPSIKIKLRPGEEQLLFSWMDHYAENLHQINIDFNQSFTEASLWMLLDKMLSQYSHLSYVIEEPTVSPSPELWRRCHEEWGVKVEMDESLRLIEDHHLREELKSVAHSWVIRPSFFSSEEMSMGLLQEAMERKKAWVLSSRLEDSEEEILRLAYLAYDMSKQGTSDLVPQGLGTLPYRGIQESSQLFLSNNKRGGYWQLPLRNKDLIPTKGA